MNLGGFSWKRFLGISAVKSRISRSIGIPLTKTGRERKLGRIVSGGGCLIMAVFWVAIPVTIAIIFLKL